MSRTMTKPRKLRQTEDEQLASIVEDVKEIEQTVKELAAAVPEPRRYTPPQCTCCTALRGDDKAEYTRVVSTQREGRLITRYLKCGFCGNTFKDLERI